MAVLCHGAAIICGLANVPNWPTSAKRDGPLEAYADARLDDIRITVVSSDHAIPRDAGQPTVGQPIARRHGDQTGQAAITGAVLRQIVILRDRQILGLRRHPG